MSAAMASGNVEFEQAIGLKVRSIKIPLIDGETLRAFHTNLWSGNSRVA